MKRLEKWNHTFPLWFLLGLASIGLPRVIAHDMKWLEPGSLVEALFALIPALIWIVVVCWKTKSASQAFYWLLSVGLGYGLLLAITHQIFWSITFTHPPTLGGNLAEIPILSWFIPRVFGVMSSLLTGSVMGLLLGSIGALINRFRNGMKREK